jgi:hypothetical protein
VTRALVAVLSLGLAALFVLALALWGRFGAAIAWDTFLAYCL